MQKPPIDYLKRTLREKAFHALNGEREHQDWKHGSLNERVMTLAGWEALLQQYMAKLDVELDHDKALGIIRELGALCVACMEQHGAPVRE